MINTSIHGITGIEVMDIKENHDGAETYYTQALEVGTERNGYIKIDLYADTKEALIPNTDTDRWRTQAAEESARADAAESLANEWMNKHAALYLKAEEYHNRAADVGQRLAALQELLHKMCDASGERTPRSMVQP